MDVNEIIRILSDIRSKYNCFDAEEEEYYRGLSEAIKMLTAQPEDKCGECDAWNQYKNYPRHQWIPCKTRLPEEDGLYLVTTSKGQVQVHVFSHNGNSEEYWMRCDKAWKPLPEPWKGEQNE